MYKSLMAEYSYYDDYEPSARELYPDEPWRHDEVPGKYSTTREGANSCGSQEPVPPPARQDQPKALKEKALKTFRRQLYDNQLRGQRCIPSRAADGATELQYQCNRPFESLRWSANVEGHFAPCTLCDLKHVIYWSNRRGTLMVHQHEPPEGVSDTAKVWLREDDLSNHYRWVNNGGPTKEQVKCRVTKDVYGQCLEIKFLEGDETMAELTKALEGPPRPLLTEFWYESMAPESHEHSVWAA